ncbi:MAG: mannose-1-phosphate guanyltransferase [Planctomycetota bacterium]|nr:MAG: mannose-1-phosphate guanyltransferase [Planctomycetota bacterium]
MLHAVIMAGGSGTRFWPESRMHRPKQLLPITGGLPMLAETVNRLDPVVPPERIYVVTHREQLAGVRAACPQLRPENLLAEPSARNTAPCVGLAATVLHARDPEAVMAVLPADHAIAPVAEFQRSLHAGAEAAARHGTFVTFGIPPTFPATGYGYIRRAGQVGTYQGLECYAVDSFTEKPDRPRAEQFLREGVYFWNSGIFMWRVDTILSAIGSHMPALAAGLAQIHEALGTPDFESVLAAVYPQLPSVPVDVGIMEKVSGTVVLRTPYRWSDVGSWNALYEEVPRDEHGNAAVFPGGGLLLAEDATGVLAYSREPQVIAVLGLDDVVVVRTEDAILVAKRDRAEEVKMLVERLKSLGRTEV